MKAVVYIDVLFIVNLFINYVLLFTTGKIAKQKISTIRLLIGALIGAFYAVMMFFPQIKALYTVVAKVVFSFVIVATSFNIIKLKAYFKTVAVFYIVSFTFGGVVFGVFFFTNMGTALGTVVSNGIFYFNLPLKTLIISTAISYAVLKCITGIFKMNKMRDYKNVQISFKGKKTTLTALVDTGNMLKEPITNTPVLVAEYRYVKCFFPESFIREYENSPTPENSIANLNDEILSKIRIIPFSSLGNSNGILIGFKPDSVIIDNIEEKNIIVGLYNNKLSSSNDYNALINPESIRRYDKKEVVR